MKAMTRTVPVVLASLFLAGGVLADSHSTGKTGEKMGEKSEKAATDMPKRTEAPGMEPRAADKQRLAGYDEKFLKQAAQASRAEVEAAKLAQEKASNPDIKSFASQMEQEHMRTQEKLKQIAASKGVDLPSEPSIAQRAKLKMLQNAEGDKFDKRYAEQFGVKAHEDSIKLFREAANKAKDAEVKSFAQETLGPLEQHLAAARTVHAGIEPTAAGQREPAARTMPEKPDMDKGEKADKPRSTY